MRKIPIAVALGVMLVPGALAACTVPKPAALPCTAVVSSPHPIQGTNEIITVRSAPGARVLTVAAFKTTSTAKTATTNSLGLARLVYNIGPAKVGFPVRVSTAVAKGNSRGGCLTSFTPVAKPISRPNPPGPPPPPPPVDPRISCADVTFQPETVPGYFPATHSFNIKALNTNCVLARALAGTAKGYHNSLGLYNAHTDGFNCGQVGTWNITDLFRVACNNPAQPDALITFQWGPFPEISCPNANPRVANILADNSDCDNATQVATSVGSELAGVGFFGAANGFTCWNFGITNTGTPIFECFSADRLSRIVLAKIY